MNENVSGTELTAVLAEILAGDRRLANALARDQQVNSQTVHRWMLRGVSTPSGRVRLEAVRIGSRWVTSDAAFARFIAATTPSTAPGQSGPPSPSPPPRRAAAEMAGQRLEAAGW